MAVAFCPLPETGGSDEKMGENDDLHSTHKNKGLHASEPETDRK